MSSQQPRPITGGLRDRLPQSLRHAILAESSGNTPGATPIASFSLAKSPPFTTAVSDTTSSNATVVPRFQPAHQESLHGRRRSWEIQPGISRREIEELRGFHPGLVPEAVETLINGPIVMQTYPRHSDVSIPTLTATFIFDKEETKTALIDARDVHTFPAFTSFVKKLMIAGTREYGIVGIGIGVVENEEAWARVRFGGLGVVVVEKVLWIAKKKEEKREWGEPRVHLRWTGRKWPPAAGEA